MYKYKLESCLNSVDSSLAGANINTGYSSLRMLVNITNYILFLVH